MRALGPLARTLLATLSGGALVALLCWIWPDGRGVALTTAERGQVTGALAAGAASSALVVHLFARRRRGALIGAAVLPTAVLLVLAIAPREGALSVRVDPIWWWIAGGVGLIGARLLTLRLAGGGAAVIALGAAVLGGLAWPRSDDPAGDPPPAGPDLLLITLDTVRADHLGFCGGDVPTAVTPRLDELAATSAVFRQAHATVALTGPSHASMFTGLPPAEHGVWVNGDRVDPALPWVPQLLAEAGWHTDATVSAAVLDASLGYDRGFARFDSTFEQRLRRGHRLIEFVGFRPRRGSAAHRSGAETLGLVPPAGGPRRTFRWVHLFDAHWPYEPSEQAARRHGLDDATPLPGELAIPFVRIRRQQIKPHHLARGRRLYRAGIDDLDGLIGRLLDAAAPDTIVVVAGDHGESLDEHGFYFAHGHAPFATDTRTPLLIRAPGWEAGAVDHPVSLMDLAPTLLELAGVSVPDGMAGRSLATPDPERVVISHSFGTGLRADDEPSAGPGVYAGIAARRGAEAALWTRELEPSLFDAVADPRELSPTPLPPAHPLWDTLRGEAARPPRPDTDDPVDGALREALEALGYVD